MTTYQFTATAVDSATGLSGALSKSFSVSPSVSTVAKYIGVRPPGNTLANFQTANTSVGPVMTARYFNGGALPAKFAGTIYDQLPAGVIPIISYKTMNTNVASFVKSVTKPTWIIYHHEPEGNDYPNGAAFVNEFKSQSDLIRAQNNPFVKVVMCAGSYQYRNGGNGTDGSYLPPSRYVDYYTIDIYQHQSQAWSWSSKGLENNQAWVNWTALVRPLGKPFGITEYGIDQDNTTTALANSTRNERIKLDCAYLRANFTPDELILWEYWWIDVGAGGNPSTSPNEYYQFTDSATENTWKQIASGTL